MENENEQIEHYRHETESDKKTLEPGKPMGIAEIRIPDKLITRLLTKSQMFTVPPSPSSRGESATSAASPILFWVGLGFGCGGFVCLFWLVLV